MNLFGVMDLSGTALTAERVRAEVVAANMANTETTRTAQGGPYQRQHVVFAASPMESIEKPSFGGVLSAQFDPIGDSVSESETGAEGVEVAGVVADQGAALRR